jgi:hypothetical protein
MEDEEKKQFEAVMNATISRFKSYFSVLNERIKKDSLVI